MTNEELKKLQNVQFKILCDTVKLCQEYNIKYYLAYGTLLGALRHKASIPWDYDIDIFMDIDNFNKFLKIHNKMEKEYEVKCVGSSLYNGLIRVYKKNTLIYSPNHGRSGAFPIHIDIFALEYAKPYKKIPQKVVNSLVEYLKIAKLSSYEKEWLYERFKDNKIKKIIVKSGDLIKKFKSEAEIEKIVHSMLVSKTEQREYICVQDSKKRFLVEDFEGDRKLLYEDKWFLVPKNTEKLLKIFYGDYMKIPPENQRFTADMDKLVVHF